MPDRGPAMKLSALTIAAALSGLFTACGGDTTTTISKTTPPATSAQTTTGAGGDTGTASCGEFTVSVAPTVTVIVLRGTACAEALRTAKAAAASKPPPPPWECAFAHAPFDRYPLPDNPKAIVGFSCGYGGTGGDLRDAPHAFVGVVAPP